MATTESEQTAMAAGATSPAEVLEFAAERGVEMVDLKFVDLPGTWQHMTLPIGALDAGDFESGLGFDGSSIRGFQEIHESDMLLIPDSSTAFIDPYYTRTTLSLICSVADPVLGEPYARDPRFVAHKAEQHLVGTGIADVAYFGPEAEFFVFDHIAYEQVEHRAFYEVDSSEGFWNTGGPVSAKPNLAYKLRQKEGYFPVPPADSLANLRSEMVATMESLGIRCEFHHHEVSSGGQGEIDMRFQPLLRMADQMMIYKYVVKNAAARRRQDGHVHAQADLPGERIGHARPPVAVEGRRSADVRAGRVRAPERSGQALHRRAAHARAGAAGVLRADHELVPPAGARVTRLPSISCIRRATGAPAYVCRCTTRRPRPSGSSSARPTRRRTRTSRSAR